MILRELCADDRDIYFEMVKEFYSSEAVLHSIPDDNIEKTFVELIRSDEYTKAFIIEDGLKIVGYVLTARHFSQEAGGEVIWIDEIFIRDEARGKGIGRKAFEQIFEYFPDAAAFRLEIEPDNERACKLYKKLGFDMLGYSQMIR